MPRDVEARKEFGRRLSAARAAVEPPLTLDQVAKRLTDEHGIETKGKQTVSAWEKGRNVPDAFTIRALARIYGKTVDSFFGDESPSARALKLAAFYDAQSATDRQALEAQWLSFAEWQRNRGQPAAPSRETLLTMDDLAKRSAQ